MEKIKELNGKYVVFSDVQGNYDALKRFFDSTKEISHDGYICLGDIVQNFDSFNDSRCLELVRNNVEFCVKGNHDSNESKISLAKIDPINLDYARKLPETLDLSDILLFHSSLAEKGRRLVQQTQLAEEILHIKKNYPNARIGLYGHTHTAEFFYQGLSHDIHFGREMELSNEVSLINPGGIGLYYNLPQTFAVLDMNKQAITFFKLDYAELLSRRARLVKAFDLRWMPHLRKESINWFEKFLKEDIVIIENYSKDDSDLLALVDILYKFSLPKDSNISRYLENYSEDLAIELHKIRNSLGELFNTPNPMKSRTDYIEVFSN